MNRQKYMSPKKFEQKVSKWVLNISDNVVNLLKPSPATSTPAMPPPVPVRNYNPTNETFATGNQNVVNVSGTIWSGTIWSAGMDIGATIINLPNNLDGVRIVHNGQNYTVVSSAVNWEADGMRRITLTAEGRAPRI